MKNCFSALYFVSQIVLFFLPSMSEASIKVRAREHYEVHQARTNDESTTFRGLSNTFNVWKEEPFKLSYGLAIGPLLGSARSNSGTKSGLGDKITLGIIGGEVKVFPSVHLNASFTRFGLGYSRLKSAGEREVLNGYHIYLGLGYEFRLNTAGLALEAAYRRSFFPDKTVLSSFTPSIGLHFYDI